MLVVKSLCGQCKNFDNFDLFTRCKLEKVDEFQADGGLTVCDKWESKS
ncbi:hypothetical protein [Methanobrevibacter olleyae]|uniref:Uncharacterized protein n=1 Tax=Methanobrevibacter olleyae TaxID=294671 RepID=A0A126R2J9_METOL|nr:hypothetical protein [Methanobrevibacter olleyae]AMK16297.1 hypothetical protein YLM1_1742 [Methanobrevibacter olleyae]